MPRLFNRNKNNDTTLLDQDDMTIASAGAFSLGASSVIDRIMGRMHKNLTGFESGRGNNSGNNNNISSASSVASSGSRMRSSFNRKSQSMRRFGSGGSAVDGGRGGFRSMSVGKFRTSPSSNLSPLGDGVNATNMVNGIMGELDSNESMALMGKSMGKRRAPSAPVLKPGAGGSARGVLGRGKGQTSNEDDAPIEYSLAELRSMSEMELERTMLKAGVSPDDISRALNDSVGMDTSIETIAEDQRKNVLVALFVNSGLVKLVRGDKARRATLLSSDKSTTVENTNESTTGGDSSSITSIPYNDEASVKSSTSSTFGGKKKSKLEKITELQSENSQVKRENKSLKKTVKKLLDQLTVLTQKEKETKALLEKIAKEEAAEEEKSKEELGDCDGKEDTATTTLKEADDKSLKSLGEGEDDDTKDEQPTQTVVKRSSNESDNSDKLINSMKKKLRDEKGAHQNTEFRLQVS